MPEEAGRRVTSVTYHVTMVAPERCASIGRNTNLHDVYYDLVAEKKAIVTATTDMCIGPYNAHTNGLCQFFIVARGRGDIARMNSAALKDRLLTWVRPEKNINVEGPNCDTVLMDPSVPPAMYNRTDVPPPPPPPRPAGLRPNATPRRSLPIGAEGTLCGVFVSLALKQYDDLGTVGVKCFMGGA